MKNPLNILIVILILYSCGKVPTPEVNKEIMRFTGDFESGNLSDFYLLVPDTTINTIVVTAPVRKGNYALKNTLQPTDYIYNGYRAELSVYNCAEYKTEVYYGFSIMIDTSYSDEEYNLICQWQDLPNYATGEEWEPTPILHGSPPPVALVYLNGNLELKMNDNPSSTNYTYLVGSEQAIIKGQWQDLVFHIYWNDDDSAFIEYWLNGNLVTPFNGTDNKVYGRNLFNRAGNYFKFGQYRGENQTANTNTVFFDEIKIGSTYNEVAP